MARWLRVEKINKEIFMVEPIIDGATAHVNTAYVLPSRTKTSLNEIIEFCKNRNLRFHREITEDNLSIEVFPAPDGSRLFWVVSAINEQTSKDTVLADGAV
jgi:hypothetical protein